MITIFVILLVLAALTGVLSVFKLLSKIVIFFIGFAIVCAILSTLFVAMKAIFKLALVVLAVSIVVKAARKYLLNEG